MSRSGKTEALLQVLRERAGDREITVIAKDASTFADNAARLGPAVKLRAIIPEHAKTSVDRGVRLREIIPRHARTRSEMLDALAGIDAFFCPTEDELRARDRAAFVDLVRREMEYAGTWVDED